jgi:hypothetical protein
VYRNVSNPKTAYQVTARFLTRGPSQHNVRRRKTDKTCRLSSGIKTVTSILNDCKTNLRKLDRLPTSSVIIIWAGVYGT